MEKLPFKVIKTEKQYYEYCNKLEALLLAGRKSQVHLDTIDLLTLLIEKWDEDHNTLEDADPVGLLKYLMSENKLRSKDLADMLEVSKSLVSDILNYRRGLSKEMIRKLAERFKVSQEAFNRPYPLTVPLKPHLNRGHLKSASRNK